MSLCVRKARLSLIFAWEGHLPGLPTYSLSLGPLGNLHGWCFCHMNADFSCPSKEGRKRRPCHLQKQTAGSLIVNTHHKTVGGNKHSSMEGSKQTNNLNSSLCNGSDHFWKRRKNPHKTKPNQTQKSKCLHSSLYLKEDLGDSNQ